MGEADRALRGQTAAAGMVLLALEELNFRSAIGRAFQRGDWGEGANLADTLQVYLERAGAASGTRRTCCLGTSRDSGGGWP